MYIDTRYGTVGMECGTLLHIFHLRKVNRMGATKDWNGMDQLDWTGLEVWCVAMGTLTWG